MTLVALLATGPIECQLQGLAGQQAEGDGNTGLLARYTDALGHLVIDVLVVSGFALDDGTQADDAIVVARPGQAVGNDGDLERPRDRHDEDPVRGDTV